MQYGVMSLFFVPGAETGYKEAQSHTFGAFPLQWVEQHIRYGDGDTLPLRGDGKTALWFECADLSHPISCGASETMAWTSGNSAELPSAVMISSCAPRSNENSK